MRVRFDPEEIKFSTFFAVQEGNGFFAGYPYQRGYGLRQSGQGLGDVLSSIWRYISPTLRTVGTTLGNEGLKTASDILSNVAQGSNVVDAIKSNATLGANRALSRLQKGGRRKVEGRAYARKPRLDAFGPV